MMTSYQNNYLKQGKKLKKKYGGCHYIKISKLANSKNADMQNINYVVEQDLLLQLNFYKDLL